MVPGLKKLLELISATPNDPRLVDRFVSLSNELSPGERADAKMQLAQILATKVPVKAIDLAWALFREGQRQPDSLKIVASALDALGKSGKALAIREDAKRLTAHPTGSHEHETARRSIQQSIVGVLTTDSGGQSLETKQTDIRQRPVEGVDVVSQQVPSIDAPTFSLESTSANADGAQSDLPRTDSRKESKQGHRLTESTDPLARVEKNGAVDVSPVASVARASAAATGAGIPEAIPKKEPSSHSKAFHERRERVSAHQVTRSSSAESPRSINMPRSNDPMACYAFVKDLITQGRWSDLLLFFDEAFKNPGDPLMVDLFQVNQLKKIDIQFAARWIDVLVDARQERRALRFMLQLLTEEPHLAWAKMVKTKLDLVTDRLGLTTIAWRDVDGVSALRLQIEQVRPKLGVYLANPPIAS